jgi:hypothetical protein
LESLIQENGALKKELAEAKALIAQLQKASGANSDIFFITDTWLTPPMLIPTNWTQYHIYGTKVINANNRGSGGVAALINPRCPYPVTQLPSPNNHTLSLKIGALRVYCVYLPLSLHLDQVQSREQSESASLSSLPAGEALFEIKKTISLQSYSR